MDESWPQSLQFMEMLVCGGQESGENFTQLSLDLYYLPITRVLSQG